MNPQTHLHDHPHDHQSYDHSHATGLRGWFANLLNPHSHDHSDLAADSAFAENELGIRTVWIALAILLFTSLLQLAIVALSGSVALLADTAHNIGDGLNSIPLLIAFYLARRLPTRRFTFGYGRSEDIAGIFIVLSILVSAGIIFWESFQRLLNPAPLENIGWVAAAAIIGFVGNELVAWLQIRVGNRIGSAALIADGLHARTDGLTSLAVLLAAGGAWLNVPLLDPIIGLGIGVVILLITWDATKRIWVRLMDGVEPELVGVVETAVMQNPQVQEIKQLRLRWLGHQLQGDLRLQLKPGADSDAVKADIRHVLSHDLPKLQDLIIEISL
ncbi:MAG: cation transporter [Ardenticatenaceae bacterium]|nr:cation transporter [Ardenticatenaceae bacterium]